MRNKIAITSLSLGFYVLTAFTSFPQLLRKMYWVGASALPQGRDEK
jgi:hypothetical protein